MNSDLNDPTGWGSESDGVRWTAEFPRPPGMRSLLDGFSIDALQEIADAQGRKRFRCRLEPGGLLALFWFAREKGESQR